MYKETIYLPDSFYFKDGHNEIIEKLRSMNYNVLKIKRKYEHEAKCEYEDICVNSEKATYCLNCVRYPNGRVDNFMCVKRRKNDESA